ncbi:hypothetical protein HYV50_03970 [Candidatus Pacearchaeota archaeon]|nr:hypothetical protein [Candidatus Pacearchaeota archaeon]
MVNASELLSKYEFHSASERMRIELPAIPTGELARDLNAIYCAAVRERFGDSKYLIADENNHGFVGNNLFKAFFGDEVFSPIGLRMPTLADLGDKRILEMVYREYYVIPTGVVLRGTDVCYEKNIGIANELTEIVKGKGFNLKEPVLINGLRVEPWVKDEEEYGLRLVPIEEKFEIIEDERLSERFNRRRFEKTDEKGLPLKAKLEKNEGSRVWYTSDARLSRLYLSGDLNVDSDGENLASSGDGGRVVLLSGEAG